MPAHHRVLHYLNRGTGQVAEERRERIWLTRKFADMIDGVDISYAKAGEELELSEHDARLLIAEGWARPARAERGTAADREPRATRDRRGHNRRREDQRP